MTGGQAGAWDRPSTTIDLRDRASIQNAIAK